MNALEAGSTIGGYKILARLRAGAMGVLYLARRVGTAGFSRPVAIKVIHDHLSNNKRFCRMFIDEAKLSARIDDPNVVRVEEFGQADGRYYLVMEYVHGASLAQAMGVLRKRGKIPMDHAVAIAMQIAGGLHGAHEATDEDGSPLGIVHRDVSPHNVLVSYLGNVRVIDFGIAKARQVGGQTKTGSLRGKLAYMPPEQARSARTVDRRADLYCVGLILWEMLTFRRVFDADNDIGIMNQIRDRDIQPPSSVEPSVPKALDDLVMRLLADDPSDRPATGAVVQRALADVYPSALRVLHGDLAVLMKKVRVGADAAANGDDDAALYGEEVRRTLTTFGSNMHDSVELAEGAIDATNPSGPDLGDGNDDDDTVGQATPSVIVSDAEAAFVVEDETTLKQRRPAPLEALKSTQRMPQGLLLTPSQGVRRIAPPAPPSSSPDVLIPPPPLSSSRALVASHRASSPEIVRASYAPVPPARPSSPSPIASRGDLTAVVPRHRADEDMVAVLAARQRIILAVGIPLIAALVVALAIVLANPPGP